MQNKFMIATAVLILLAAALLLAACAGNSGQAATGSPSITPTIENSGAFQWPEALHFAATGSSGEAKVVSWASVMQTDLNGPIIRVVNEAAWTNAYKDMAANKMVLSQMDKSTLRDSIEARSEYASSDGGPWMAGLVWVDSLASTGFVVRGNSSIYRPEDIKAGTKIAIWNDKSATLTPFRSLLAWGNVSEKDITWVNTGDYDAGPRAVAEGRADICMAAPVAPSVMEASAAPSGIRYISLDPKDNPQGAQRFLRISTLYDFGPIAVGPESAVGTSSIISYKYLGANMDTDPELIYNIAKWLDQNYAKYSDRYESNQNMTFNDVIEALQTIYIPVHPGLLKYLKEKGVWNQDYENRNQKNIALFEQYKNGYQNAMKQAAAQQIEVKPNNQAWIELWENYKLNNEIPVIGMHVSLTQDAPNTLPSGYIAPGVTPTPSPSPSPSPTTTSSATLEVPLEVQSISDAHPGDDVTVVIKAAPGAEVNILFTMPNGSNSAYPQDNTKVAGPDGVITWTWNINSHVPAGEAIYTFTAKLDGKQSVVVIKKTI